MTNVNMAKNKHLTTKYNENEEMNLEGHLSVDQDNPNKNNEVPAVTTKNSYLNAVVKTHQPVSKNSEGVHLLPASPPSKVGGEDAIKKKNLADTKDEEKEQGNLNSKKYKLVSKNKRGTD